MLGLHGFEKSMKSGIVPTIKPTTCLASTLIATSHNGTKDEDKGAEEETSNLLVTESI